MYFTFFDISALSYIFFRIALLGSCRVTKNTRNGSVWQLTLYLTQGPSAGSRSRDKRGARSSRPLAKGGGGGGSGVSKKNFSALWTLVWSTNKGVGPPDPSSRSATGTLACIAFGDVEAHRKNQLLVYLKRMVIYLVNFKWKKVLSVHQL